MPSTEVTTIDLFAASEREETIAIDLTDKFFEDVEQNEIIGGQLHLEVSVRVKTTDYFEVSYHITGNVNVACDRCLEAVIYDIDTEDSVLVFSGEGEPTNDEARILPPRSNHYDLSWDVYETVALSLPIQRTHAEGECNADMLHRFTVEED